MSRRILLSCGEASGDMYAGALAAELRRQSPGLAIAGIAGPAFAAGGGDVLVDYRGISVTGYVEILGRLRALRDARQRLVTDARRERPDALVVIDNSGFNIRLARDIKALGVPVFYYVSPQIWAWRTGRIKAIREVADRMLVIFPFEEAIYRDAGVPVTFVGHPLIDLIRVDASRESFLASLNLPGDAPTVAVLPGSRKSEVTRILPVLIDAARRIRGAVPRAQFVCARAPHLADGLFEPMQTLDGSATVVGRTDSVLASADVVLTASGTATVQTALHDRPMVVVYRLSPLEYRLGRRFVKLDTFAMVNLIAGTRLVPELIQDDCTAENVAAEAVSMLTDPARVERIRAGLADVRRKLGGPGASARAAAVILERVGAK